MKERFEEPQMEIIELSGSIVLSNSSDNDDDF